MIATVTNETLESRRTGKNYWTIIGHSEFDLFNYKHETLKECIERVFSADLSDCSRRKDTIYAKHFWRYILERLNAEGNLTDKIRNRLRNDNSFRYRLQEIGFITGCNHVNVIHSVKTAQNLIYTDKDYRAKYEAVIKKMQFNLITL